MLSNKLSRRALLAAGGSLAAVPFLPRTALSQSFDWQSQKGTSIEVNIVKSVYADLFERRIHEFEELTGIKVGFEAIPQQQQWQKVMVELSSGRPSFDVVWVSYHVQKKRMEQNGWLADLTPLLEDAQLRDPELDVDDFAQAGLENARDPEGKLRSFPVTHTYWILAYNKELFAQKGLAAPTTFEEMVSAAGALTDPANGIYGFVGRGLKNANVPVWTNLVLGLGGDLLATDSAEAIEAGRLFKVLMADCAPPGSAGFNWNECQSAFLQGHAAMWIDGNGLMPPLEDPSKSRVVGKVGYAVVPMGPKAHASPTFGEGIGIAAASDKQKAAFLFCQWMVSKSLQAELFTTGAGVPTRMSVLADQSVRDAVEMPPDWSEAVAGSGRISRLGLPVITPVQEYRDIFGIALVNLIGGADPEAELKRATAEFKPILEKAG